MLDKEKKQIEKELSAELAEIIKEGNADVERVKYLISVGADINYSGFKPMHYATKRKQFEVIDALIDAGALNYPRNIELVAHVCDYRDFDDVAEERFFELIEKCLKIAGTKEEYLAPYVNCMLVNGKSEKLVTAGFRFRMTESEFAALVYPRAIYEVIEFRQIKSLEFINRNLNWINQQTLDDAVLTGETAVVRYIFEHSELVPSNKVILRPLEPNMDFLVRTRLEQIKQKKTG